MSEQLEAPTLPKGYFFRVNKPDGVGDVMVELRKRGFLGSRRVSLGWVFESDVRYDKQGMASYIRTKMVYLRDSLVAELANANCAGDYPPKKIIG